MNSPKPNPMPLIIALITLIGLVVHAQQAGGGISVPIVPITYNITIQINTECPLCVETNPAYAPLANSWAWAAGKQFTLVIRDLGQVTALENVVVDATADSKGYVKFKVEASPTDINTYTNWTVALLAKWHGHYFLLFENQYVNATFAQVMANLTGWYYTVLPDGTVVAEDLTGGGSQYDPALAPPANDGLNYGYNGPWGVFTQVNGTLQFVNFTSAALHQFYLAVATANQPYNLTLSLALRINNASVHTWTYEPIANWANGTVFGPITYLGTYVTELGGAGQSVSGFLSPLNISYGFAVTMWFPYADGYIPQTVINSTNGIFTIALPYNAAPDPTGFYVIKTLNYTRGYYGPADSVSATCQQLVIWPFPLSRLTVEGLFDIKGNPVLNPQYFKFIIQETIGGRHVTISSQRGMWDMNSFLDAICYGTTDPGSLGWCLSYITRDELVEAALSAYTPVTLTWISGMLALTNDKASVSPLDLKPRLRVEYRSSRNGYVPVLQAPLNATEPINLVVNLTVSVLPVQIPLWWRNGQPLPNGQPFYDQDLLGNLTFKIVGTSGVNWIQSGQEAVVKDLWPGTMAGVNQNEGLYLWALPPYELIPGIVGARYVLLSLLNASGYLPLPALYALLTNSGGVYDFRYLNASQLNDPAISNFFNTYDMSAGANSYTYNFRIYYNSILVGTANVVARYPEVHPNGTIIETQDNVAGVLRVDYGPYSSKPYTDAYAVQSKYYDQTADVYGLQGPELAAYRLQHAVHIGVDIKNVFIQFKDFCGNPLPPINGTINLVVNYNGLKISEQLGARNEEVVKIPVPMNFYGKPLSKSATAYVTLNYFGYVLNGTDNNSALPTSPTPITIPLVGTPYPKPTVYLPVAPQMFQVLAAVWTTDFTTWEPQYLGPQYPLAGFVVVPIGKDGARMGQSISNASGYAFFDALPLGVNFTLIVRTLDPAVDKLWQQLYYFTPKQELNNNSYAKYAKWLYAEFTPDDDVYTLGTRGPIDAGLIVNKTTIRLTSWCGVPPITAEAQVYNPVFRAFDKTGKYLLSSQFVTPGPYPGAARSMLVNVAFVVADEFSPYNYSSRWLNLTDNEYVALTDFRLVGMTGMRSILNDLAAKYFDMAVVRSNNTCWLRGNYSYATAALAYAAMASWLANSSTDLYSAVFRLYSAQPKNGTSSICDLTPTTVGTYDMAHLFLPGMRLRVKVWYMGYMVYDGYVTLDKPTVDIRTEVVPVNVTALTKDLRLPVDSYVGFTLANGYFGLALKGPYDYNFTGARSLKSLASPYGFGIGSLQQLLVDPTGNSTSMLYNTKVFYNVTGRYAYYGNYTPAQSGADIVYLPNLVVLRNATIAKYLYTVANGVEYMASFDRWLLIKHPRALVRAYDQFERNTFYNLLTLGNTPNATLPGAVPVSVNFVETSNGVYTTSFLIYTYNSTNATNLLNYRTLLFYLPWGNGTNATVTVKVVNVTNGVTYTASYSLSEYASLWQNLLAYEINLRNLALKVAPGDMPVKVRFEITVKYTKGPTARYYAEPKAYLLKGVGLTAYYVNATVGVADGKTISYRTVNLTAAGSAWSTYGGFGMPVTYVVKAGEIALLPAWASNTAAAGSYISRIWIIAAGSKQALCTDKPAVRGPLTDAKGANVVGYDFFDRKYLVVNYLPDSTPATKPSVPIWTSTSLDEFFDGSGKIAGLGFPIGGTSAFAIAHYVGAPVWNVTALYPDRTTLKLPTTALDWLTVYNDAPFPILASGVTMKCGGKSYTIPASSAAAGYAYVGAGQQKTVMLNDYGFGRSYAINASYLWSPYVYAPNYTYAVTAYYGGIVDMLEYFKNAIAEQAKRTLSNAVRTELEAALIKIDDLLGDYMALVNAFDLQPLSSRPVIENVLYASHAEDSISSYTFNILSYTGAKTSVDETASGAWGQLTVSSNDYDFKYYFNFSVLPLKYILDWNARDSVANQTIVLFDRWGHVYAVIYTDNLGKLAYPLPDISTMGKSSVIYVSWFDGYPLSVLTGNPAYLIWIYQQDVYNDVYHLGNATTTTRLRTYVYPATLTVKADGRPLAGVEVQFYDQATGGAMFYFNDITSSSGAVTVWDRLISNYPTGFRSQLPATNFASQVLYPYVNGSAAAPASNEPIWVVVATSTHSIQRGGEEPSTSYNFESTIDLLTQLPIVQPVGVSGYFIMSTQQGNIVIPFKPAIAAGTSYLVATQPISASISYPLTMTVEAVHVGDAAIELTKPFTASFITTALPPSLDLASLGLLAPVTVKAVDGFGKLRTDWSVTISIGGRTIAGGGGQVTAYLPLTQYADSYTATVATTVKTPTGAVVIKDEIFAVAGPATYEVKVPSAVILASVVDGFGTALTDVPVRIADAASGTGSIDVEVLAGKYTVAAQAYGYTWSKSVSVSPGQTATVSIEIPTAKIDVQVINQARGAQGPWTVQIVGPSGVIASGSGSASAVVLALDNASTPLSYTAITSTPFGTYSTGTLTLRPGEVTSTAIIVPTAILQISAVDDNGYPINSLVSQVDVYYANGTLYKSFAAAPAEVEVLGGQQYTIKVIAQRNHIGTYSITPPAGQTVAVRVAVPGTAGITIFGARIPISQLVLWLVLTIVIVIIIAILLIEYSNWRRRRIMQILAPPK